MLLKSARAALAAVALLAAPASAYAINVSSGDATGYQNVTARYGNGAAVDDKLRSYRSDRGVYYRGLVDWGKWYCSNTDTGRYSRITSSTSLVQAGGNIIAMSGPGCGGDVAPRTSICRDIDFLPDTCSAWTNRF